MPVNAEQLKETTVSDKEELINVFDVVRNFFVNSFEEQKHVTTILLFTKLQKFRATYIHSIFSIYSIYFQGIF